jgi:hypothetical protein
MIHSAGGPLADGYHIKSQEGALHWRRPPATSCCDQVGAGWRTAAPVVQRDRCELAGGKTVLQSLSNGGAIIFDVPSIGGSPLPAGPYRAREACGRSCHRAAATLVELPATIAAAGLPISPCREIGSLRDRSHRTRRTPSTPPFPPPEGHLTGTTNSQGLARFLTEPGFCLASGQTGGVSSAPMSRRGFR